MSVKLSKRSMINYIKHHCSDLSLDEKQSILQMIINSNIPDKKIQTKGGGTQIKFSDIPNNIINMIYNYIETRIKSRKSEIQYFPDDNIKI